jgi:1-deoxy-D-xylulose-5-phosphate synthase
MLDTALEMSGPSAIRYPRGAARQVPSDQVGSGLNARLLRRSETGEVCILAVGKMLEAAEEAVELLADDDIDATLWDVRIVRPLDPRMVVDAGKHRLVVTVEDGVRSGGAGSYIAETVADLQESRIAPPFLILGVPTAFIPHGSQEQILSQLGLDGPGIAAAVAKAVHRPA